MKEYICEEGKDIGVWTTVRRKGELIRCKDCKRFYQNDQSASQCKYSGNKDGYCFMAERKEE